MEIYRLCKIVSDAFLCVGLYQSATEQGVVNYLYYSGEFDRHNIKIKGHHMNDHHIISCSEHLNIAGTKYCQEWYIVHHCFHIKYRTYLTPQIKELMSIPCK